MATSATPAAPTNGISSRSLALACGVLLLAGCAWHRVEPRLDRAPSPDQGAAVGLVAADDETSLTDLRAIARLWSAWKAFERVTFPFREGDPVELVVELRLRQHVDLHRGANRVKAVALGLTLGLLSPVVGSRVTERHDVTVRCLRGAEVVGPFERTVSTDVVFGIGADPIRVTAALDAEQVKRVASSVLETVVSSCRGGAASPRKHDGRGP